MLFFSDAIFAIAITLLVVDIKVPYTASRTLGANLELRDALPQILAFFISFAVIGLFWMGHHGLFRRIIAVDQRLMVINLLFAGAIAFLPYPTALLSASSPGDTTATVFYAAWVAGAGLAEAWIWLHASARRNPGLIASGVTPELRRYLTLRILRIPAVFLLSIPVAFTTPQAARYVWILAWPVGAALRLTMLPTEAEEIPQPGG